jgi:cellulose synthase/poly-beta-1,6-N-acetylglucosamine synthase-like glycosyltransferase
MKISILIPCYNEELTIERCLNSCLNQTRPADEIIVADDSSTDKTPEILKKFEGKIKIVRTIKNTGTKSHAQEYGLKFVTGDIYIATDGDTTLDKNFVKTIEEEMQNPAVAAVAGYVKSMRYNWVTASRALDYAISQNIDKLAQEYIGFIFVIPGAAGAFRTKIFREQILFTHDTITEDLDFTYRLNKSHQKIKYSRKAICYTQDPPTLNAYINQMRRWFGGGWQNIRKHLTIPNSPGMALELSLIYAEGLAFSLVLFILPLINFYLTIYIFFLYLSITICLALFGAYKERRPDLLLALPGYIFLRYVNAYIFMEQFLKQIVFRRKDLYWFKPDRVEIKS